MVSHDQAFLKEVCEEVVELDAEGGQLLHFHDGYEEFLGGLAGGGTGRGGGGG